MGIFLLVMAATLGAAEPPSWSPAHSMKFLTVGAVTPSPDARWVLWTETGNVMEKEKSETLTHIFVARADGSGRFQLTRGDKSANAPKWSPDSASVYFLSDRSGKPNLYRIAIAGGESEKLTDWKGTISGFAVSPDGARIAFTGRDEDKEVEEKRKARLDFKVLDDAPRNAGLWVTAPNGKPERIAGGDVHVAAFDWSPDSKHIAFQHAPRPDADSARLADVSEVEVATKAVRKVAATEVAETAPVYSPDGRFLAIERAQTRNRFGGTRVVLVNRADNGARALAATPDEQPNVVAWAPDSRSLVVNEVRATRAVLYRLPIDAPAGVLYSPQRGTFVPGGAADRKGEVIGIAFQSPDEPVEALLLKLSDGGKTVVSAANSGIEKPPLGKTEVVRWKAKDGREIDGLLTIPAGYEKGKRVPLILNIHGGPAGVFTESFTGAAGLYPIAAFAAKGYAVLRPNPRGSSGYGTKFRESVVTDWGGGDFGDLMSGVDHVIAQGIADPARLAVMGWSYGGYMTAWTVTQTTRFKAAAVGAGITNHVSMYGTQDIPTVYEDYFGGTPWTQPEVYARSSPINFASRIRTPTLLLHGENDDRVPPTQAHEFYRAVKKQGVEARMVVYPRQPHGPREPKFLEHIMNEHLAWVEKHLGAPIQVP